MDELDLMDRAYLVRMRAILALCEQEIGRAQPQRSKDTFDLANQRASGIQSAWITLEAHIQATHLQERRVTRDGVVQSLATDRGRVLEERVRYTDPASPECYRNEDIRTAARLRLDTHLATLDTIRGYIERGELVI